MRIIDNSGKKDFYDITQASGQDQNVIYQRNEKIYSKDEIDSEISKSNKVFNNFVTLKLLWGFSDSAISSFKASHPELNNWWRTYYMIETKSENKTKTYIAKLCIFYFCGKAYKCVVIYRHTKEFLNYLKFNPKKYDFYHVPEFPDENQWIFTREQFQEFLEKNGAIEYINSLTKSYRNFEMRSIDFINEWLNPFYEIKPPEEILVEGKIVSALYAPLHDSLNRAPLNKGKWTIIIDPILGANGIQFCKIKDAFLTYQDIDMYINGVLTNPQNPPVTVSDDEKIKKHGFDTKYGFRKRK